MQALSWRQKVLVELLVENFDVINLDLEQPLVLQKY